MFFFPSSRLKRGVNLQRKSATSHKKTAVGTWKKSGIFYNLMTTAWQWTPSFATFFCTIFLCNLVFSHYTETFGASFCCGIVSHPALLRISMLARCPTHLTFNWRYAQITMPHQTAPDLRQPSAVSTSWISSRIKMWSCPTTIYATGEFLLLFTLNEVAFSCARLT